MTQFVQGRPTPNRNFSRAGAQTALPFPGGSFGTSRPHGTGFSNTLIQSQQNRTLGQTPGTVFNQPPRANFGPQGFSGPSAMPFGNFNRVGQPTGNFGLETQQAQTLGQTPGSIMPLSLGPPPAQLGSANLGIVPPSTQQLGGPTQQIGGGFPMGGRLGNAITEMIMQSSLGGQGIGSQMRQQQQMQRRQNPGAAIQQLLRGLFGG